MNGSVLRLDHRILNMQRDTFHKSCLIFHCILIMQGILDHLSLSLLLHVDTLSGITAGEQNTQGCSLTFSLLPSSTF